MSIGPCLRRVAHVTAAAAALAVMGGAAFAQGKLDARYTASLAGVPVGKGAWAVEIAEDRYSSAASGRATGLMRAVAKGEGQAAARGLLSDGRLVPAAYAVSARTDDRHDQIRMTIAAGLVRDVAVEPPVEEDDDRIPVTEAHRRNVVDPMTAGLLLVPGSADPIGAATCERTLPIFDGRQRYDLVLGFKRLDKVKAEKGYEGPVVVCSVAFKPIAGHRPGRAAIKYLMQNRDMEVWLAPIAGTRVVAPFKIVIPTMIGPAVLQATQFVTTASARTAKTQ